MEAAKETKFGTKVAWGMMMMPEYTHSTEKARDTTLDDEKQSSQHNSVVITLTKGRHVPANKRALTLRTSVTVVMLLVK